MICSYTLRSFYVALNETGKSDSAHLDSWEQEQVSSVKGHQVTSNSIQHIIF